MQAKSGTMRIATGASAVSGPADADRPGRISRA